jgi:hypothetical protein
MSDEDDRKDSKPADEGIETKPRGNPDTDQESVDKLERVKPY